MNFDFGYSVLHKGKVLFIAKGINFGYNSQLPWKDNLNFQISSVERIALKGTNGSGKTTLIKLILGIIEPRAEEFVYREFAIKELVSNKINKWLAIFAATFPFIFQHGLKSIDQFWWFLIWGIVFGILFYD